MHSGALIDAHVHFYSAYNARKFLDAASDSFARRPQSSAARVLCMAESASDNWFGRLQSNADSLAETGWRLIATQEAESLRLQRVEDGSELIVIAGHQCVAAEDIEVLVLGSLAKFPDGQPAAQIIEAALAANALPLLPWGFGKWFGRRGQLVQSLMSQFGQQLLLGDNSGRLGGLGLPRLLRVGAQQGFCLLPGSDPLPMRGEEHKVGSFGAFVDGQLGNEHPLADLRALLAACQRAGQPPLSPYGEGESLLRFVRNQLLMQFRKRRGARA